LILEAGLRLANQGDDEHEMKSTFLTIGLVFLGLVLLTFAAFEGTLLGQDLGVAHSEPVMVFVIPNLDDARRVRSAIRPERIKWQGKQGLALTGGRVVALDLGNAGVVINEAGWVDRPIQIVRLDHPESMAGDPGQDTTQAGAGSREARLIRLRSLVGQPTLSRSEQLFVLTAMNDGIEI